MKYPFSPEYLEELPEELTQLFRQLEIDLLQRICKRLAQAGTLNQSSVHDMQVLRALGLSQNEINRAIQNTLKISQSKLQKLFDTIVAQNQQYYNTLITLADLTAPETLIGQSDIDAIVAQTQEELTNITRSMGFSINRGKTFLPPAKAYQWALDNATNQVVSGATSYTDAIRTTTLQLSRQGLQTVQYGNRHHALDVAVRRAILTGITQVCDQYTQQAAEELGTRYYEVTAHSGARDKPGPMGWEDHKAWQGRVYYQSEHGEADPLGKYPDFVKKTGYGDVTGLMGANCRHYRHPWIEGVSERTYTDNELAHIDDGKGCIYNGRQYSAYEATQQQRLLERSIRALKREIAALEAAGCPEEDILPLRTQLKRLTDEYKNFSAAAGLPEYLDRLEVLKNHSTGSTLTNVTNEYLQNATPGVGSVTIPTTGYSPKHHAREISVAKWIQTKFGGNIELLKESKINGVKRPDYFWNSKLWELKSVSSISSTDSQIRKGAKQIVSNPGGIILDYQQNSINTAQVLQTIKRRLDRSGVLNEADIMILQNNDLKDVLRYKK